MKRDHRGRFAPRPSREAVPLLLASAPRPRSAAVRKGWQRRRDDRLLEVFAQLLELTGGYPGPKALRWMERARG